MRLWLNRSGEIPLREQLITQVVLGILTREMPPGALENQFGAGGAHRPHGFGRVRTPRPAPNRLILHQVGGMR
jgi:hypothetical protein